MFSASRTSQNRQHQTAEQQQSSAWRPMGSVVNMLLERLRCGTRCLDLGHRGDTEELMVNLSNVLPGRPTHCDCFFAGASLPEPTESFEEISKFNLGVNRKRLHLVSYAERNPFKYRVGETIWKNVRTSVRPSCFLLPDSLHQWRYPTSTNPQMTRDDDRSFSCISCEKVLDCLLIYSRLTPKKCLRPCQGEIRKPDNWKEPTKMAQGNLPFFRNFAPDFPCTNPRSQRSSNNRHLPVAISSKLQGTWVETCLRGRLAWTKRAPRESPNLWSRDMTKNNDNKYRTLCSLSLFLPWDLFLSRSHSANEFMDMQSHPSPGVQGEMWEVRVFR